MWFLSVFPNKQGSSPEEEICNFWAHDWANMWIFLLAIWPLIKADTAWVRRVKELALGSSQGVLSGQAAGGREGFGDLKDTPDGVRTPWSISNLGSGSITASIRHAVFISEVWENSMQEHRRLGVLLSPYSLAHMNGISCCLFLSKFMIKYFCNYFVDLKLSLGKKHFYGLFSTLVNRLINQYIDF